MAGLGVGRQSVCMHQWRHTGAEKIQFHSLLSFGCGQPHVLATLLLGTEVPCFLPLSWSLWGSLSWTGHSGEENNLLLLPGLKTPDHPACSTVIITTPFQLLENHPNLLLIFQIFRFYWKGHGSHSQSWSLKHHPMFNFNIFPDTATEIVSLHNVWIKKICWLQASCVSIIFSTGEKKYNDNTWIKLHTVFSDMSICSCYVCKLSTYYYR